MGTSNGRDLRYAEQMTQDRLVTGLEVVLSKNISVALSYDGTTGEKVYGPPLPSHLNMTQTFIHVGRSTQSTLSGKADETIESLYLSKDLKPSFVNIRVGKEAENMQMDLMI
jgi:DNA adenine methylase